MKSEKAEALESDGLKLTNNQLTMDNHKPNTIKFQYHCSFCACELLSDDSVRFNGVGACPACNELAYFWVDSLRYYKANYPLIWGGA